MPDDADDFQSDLSEAIRSIGEVIDPIAQGVRVRIAVEINRLNAQVAQVHADLNAWVLAQLAQHA